MASILVIDDDHLAAELYTSLLRAFGHETAYVTSGKEAIVHLGSARPDLIMLDIMMPEMNGLDLLRKLKSDKQTSGIRVAIFSALDETAWRERAAGAGACEYWIKGGFDFGELQEKVAACLAGVNRSSAREESSRIDSDEVDGGAAPNARGGRQTSADAGALDAGARIVSSVRNYPGMQAVIAEYVEILPEEIRKMQHFLDCGQMQSLKRVAHQLRGTGGGYGFELISDLAADVEAAINADDPPASIAIKTNSLIGAIRRVEGFDDRAAVVPGRGGAL